jgi:hypothetical protein
MHGARDLLWLAVKAKTGASRAAYIFAGAAVVSLVAGATFLFVALYLFLARHYGALEAAFALALALLAVSFIALVFAGIVRRKTSERARAEIAETRNKLLTDPRIVAVGAQMGRSLGWQRVVPIAVLGLLIFGWSRAMARKSSNRRSNDERPSS